MRRLTLLVALASAAVAAPAAANPTAEAELRDNGSIGGGAYNGSISVNANLNFTRTTSVGPSVDPNGLFPIVVDPNDPPEPPVSATSETLQVSGHVGICNYAVFQCSNLFFSQLPTGSALTIEDLPAVGNSITWNIAAVANGSLGAVPVTATLTAARPAMSTTQPFGGSQQVNPWTDGSDVHAEVRSDTPILSRGAYTISGSFQTPFGTFPVQGGYAFLNRFLHTEAVANATLPAA